MVDSVYPRPGRLIADKYQLDAMIGEGAMGTVWSATHVNLNQRVAVKLILPELADSESVRQRFEAEAKAAAALRSRFVVQVYDSGINEEGVPYLVMEYLQGESLEDTIEKSGALSLEYGIQVIAQVAKGLARAHSQGIVHRDLKPANVFMAQTDDGDEVAKILDFGIAKFQREGPNVSSTATGTVVGTPLFMSPEQARGKKGIDHRSDLYSLGAMTFYVLTGKHAFGGEALGELILAICTKPLPSLIAQRSGLPPGLDAWYHRSCAREPEDRFQSAEEMVAALIDASGVDEALLRAAGVVTRMTDFGSRFAMQSSPDLGGSGTLSGVDDSSVQHAILDVGTLESDPGTGPAASAETVLAGATHPGVSRTSPSESPPRRRTPVGLIVGVFAFLGVGAVVAGLALAGSPADAAAPAVPAGPETSTAPAATHSARARPDEPEVAPDEPDSESASDEGEEVDDDDPVEPEVASSGPAPAQPTAAPPPAWNQSSGAKPVTRQPPTGKPTGNQSAGSKPAGSQGIDIGF
jgi:serine/threonine protein kinase